MNYNKFRRAQSGSLQKVKIFLFAFVITISQTAFSQVINGTKYIPGDYASISAAVTALNAGTLGSGGVVFSVAAGNVETLTSAIVLTKTGTSAKPIIFQKNGAGANPKIIAYTGTSTTIDGIFKLQGIDYLTIDGIDLAESASNTTSTTRMEWGYALLKNSSSDGCQYVTIKNCAITLSHLDNASCGIYGDCYMPDGTSVTITNNNGANSNGQFYSNTITDANTGIKLIGYSNTSYYDTNNDIGSSGANTINTFGGNSITGSGIYVTNQTILKIANNIITSGSGSGAGAVNALYGIYINSTSANALENTYVYSNQINTISSSGTAPVYGIYASSQNLKSIYQNTINTLSSAGGFITAISIDGASGTTTDIYRNKIYDLSSTTAAGTASGIYVNSGITINVSNNILGDIKATAATGNNAVIGLNFNAATTINAYYNTIYLSGSGGNGFGTSGIYIIGTIYFLSNNNIVINNTTPVGAGLAVAYRRSSNNLTPYYTNSSNNNYYTGAPSATHLIFYDGTTSEQTLCDYLNFIGLPREKNSITENSTFISTVGSDPNYLHLNTTSGNLAEGGGIEISGYTSDFDATSSRPAGGYPLGGQANGGGKLPDIGADESDAKPGNMKYVCSTVTQVGGIATQGATNQSIIRIDVYIAGYNSVINATQFSVNASGTTNIADINSTTAKIYYTGTSQTFSTSTLFGSLTPTIANFNVAGTQALQYGVNYFWLAYDIAAGATCGNLIDGQCTSITVAAAANTPTVTSPTGNKIIKGGCSIAFYTIDNTLPASCTNYTSFTSAIADLNLGNPTCPTTYYVTAGQVFNEGNLAITATGTSSAPIVFQKSGGGANPKILSVPGVGTVDGIVKLIGSDYVTFDGIDVEDNSLNTTFSTRFEWGYALLRASGYDGCQHNTIKNCTVKLNKVNTQCAGIYGGNHMKDTILAIAILSVAGTNSYNQFYNNTCTNVYSGVYFLGYNQSTTPYDLYDQSNEFGVSGGNTFSDYGGGAVIAAGIFVSCQNNLKIANNTMGSSNTTGLVNPAAKLCGIYLDIGNNSNADVYSNNITASTSAANMDAYGIYSNMGGSGTSNTINIYSNTIQSVTSNNAPCAIRCDASPKTLNIYSNEIKKCRNTGGVSFYGIYSNTSVTSSLNIYSNTIHDCYSKTIWGGIYSAQSNNSSEIYSNQIYNDTVTASTDGTFTGISTGSSSSSVLCHDNLVHDIKITSSGGVTGPVLTGITGTNNTSDIYNNSIYNLTCTNTGSPAAENEITMGGTSATVRSNTIYNNSSSNSHTGINVNTATVTGICSVHDNTLHDLTSTNGIVYGISSSNNGLSETVYLNTLYNLTGSSASNAVGALGLSLSGAPSGLKTVYDNTIHDVTGGLATGLYSLCSGTGGGSAYRNKIYTIKATNSTGLSKGLELSGGTGTAYNNFVAEIKNTAGTLAENVYGIYANCTTVKLYYNSVSITGSGGGSSFGTVGMYINGTSSEEWINNLVVNNATPGSSGKVIAIRKGTSNLGIVSNSTNRQCFYAGTPSASHLIYYDGTNSYQTILTYSSFMSPRESYLVNANVPFTSSTDLHTTSGYVQDKGIAIASVTTDIDLEGRPLCASPDLGADEYIACLPLPIELVEFNGVIMNAVVQLSWLTASEINNDYFTIEKSFDGTSFSPIGTIEGAGTSNEPHDYGIMDEHPYSGITYYRLKQTDFDGTNTYSEIISVKNEPIISITSNAFFNSSTNSIDVEFISNLSMLANIQITNAEGILISNTYNNTDVIAKINAENLPSGIYFVSVIVNGKKQVQKVSIIR